MTYKDSNRGYNSGRAISMATIILVIVFLWETPYIFPFKLLVVFFQELSHGLATVLTGGEIEKIEVSPRLGGVCWTIGGSQFLILSAGYLGSLFFGAGILLAVAYSKRDAMITALLGILMVVITAIYVRPIAGFGFVFCLTGGLLLVTAAGVLRHEINDFILMTIGLASCLYAPIDILEDIIFRTVPGSDAEALAKLTNVPSQAWGGASVIIAVVTAALVMRKVILIRS